MKYKQNIEVQVTTGVILQEVMKGTGYNKRIRGT